MACSSGGYGVVRGVCIYIKGGCISMRVVNIRGEIGMWWIKVCNNSTKETGTYCYETHDEFLIGREHAMRLNGIRVLKFGCTGY